MVGDIPLHDDNILALYHKIKTQPVEFNDDHKLALSPEIRDLITKMLIKDPNERITLAEIKVPLTQLLDKKNVLHKITPIFLSDADICIFPIVTET